jgi:hypothetical protein
MKIYEKMYYDARNMFINFILDLFTKSLRRKKNDELLSAGLTNSQLKLRKYFKNVNAIPKIHKYLYKVLLYVNYESIILNMHVLFKKMRKTWKIELLLVPEN